MTPISPVANPAPRACGDLVLSFSGKFPSRRRIDSSGFRIEAREDGWTLFMQDVGPGWKGFPLVRAETDDMSLWCLGELYALAPGTDRASLLLEVARGERSAGDLNGHFLLLVWNRSSRRWHVFTDRFGTIHAYVATDARTRALGTFSPAVYAECSNRGFDPESVTAFFAFGFFPGGQTHLRNTKILPPATHIVLSENGESLREHRTWRWNQSPDHTRTYDDTVDALASILAEVLRDHTREGRIAVPISGGLDSRTSVALLTRAGESPPQRFWAYSYGYGEDSVETRIARRVAGARGLAFESFRVPAYLFDRLEHVLACVEGFQDLTQCRQAAVVDELGAHADAVVAAHWGDVWLDDSGLAATVAETARAGLAEHIFGKMSKRGRDWLLTRLAKPLLGGRDPEGMARELLLGDLTPYDGLGEPDFAVKAFKTDHWSFRWTLASLRMFQAGAFPRLPFYDNRMADFFSTVPSEFVAGRRLQIDLLKRHAPDLARITWQARDANLYWATRPDVLLLPRRAMKKLARLVTGRHVIERNWEVQFLSDSGRAGLERWLLAPGLKLHDLVSRSEVVGLLADFFRAPFEAGRGYTVSMLLTFSAWLETYG